MRAAWEIPVTVSPEFGRQCLPNLWISGVEQSAVPEIADFQTFGSKVFCERFQQHLTILCPIASVLLEFENPRSNEPVAHDEGLVDCHDGSALKLSGGGLDGFDQGGVFHAPRFEPDWKYLPAWFFPDRDASLRPPMAPGGH